MSFNEGNMSLSLQFSRGLCDKEFDQVGIPSRMKRYDGQIPVSQNRFLPRRQRCTVSSCCSRLLLGRVVKQHGRVYKGTGGMSPGSCFELLNEHGHGHGHTHSRVRENGDNTYHR